MGKLNVLLICGGRSPEHEISIRSAKSILDAMDKAIYNPVVVIISRVGVWHMLESASQLHQYTAVKAGAKCNVCTLLRIDDEAVVLRVLDAQFDRPIDVVFSIMHGEHGEDGAIQGFCEIVGVPYVGSGICASAIGMNKSTSNERFHAAGLDCIPSIDITCPYYPPYEEAVVKLESEVLFVKAANLGSSIGVYKVRSEDEYEQAIKSVYTYTDIAIIQRYISCEELECAVLGGVDPIVSAVGCIIPNHDFYSYEAKYLDESGAVLEIPAKISPEIANKVRIMAVKAFHAIRCYGMARVDFFMEKDSCKLYINEINTAPGFTNISMYPALFQEIGISQQVLITKLIELAIERHKMYSSFKRQ